MPDCGISALIFFFSLCTLRFQLIFAFEFCALVFFAHIHLLVELPLRQSDSVCVVVAVVMCLDANECETGEVFPAVAIAREIKVTKNKQ